MQKTNLHSLQAPPTVERLLRFRNKRKFGFTLAEVLITLAIIGIIAAMTVPTILSNVNEQGWRSAFLKNYALIRQAHQLSIRNGEDFFEGWESTAFINPIYVSTPSLMKQYFKIAKGPFVSTWGSPAAIRQVYSASGDVNQLFKLLNGSIGSYWQNVFVCSFQLEDGTIIIFHHTNCHYTTIMVDVNGTKGPNTFGKDIYFLEYTISISGSPIRNTALFNQIVPYGIRGTQACGGGLYWNEPVTDCTKTGEGRMCAREIVKSKNFKIK